ncbi:MAG: hypothetical protein QM778_36560 [Myxococcales bacterium]
MRIGSRFCGPPASGNGGYTAGCVARLIQGPAEVTLRAPPPLDTELTLESRDGGAVLLGPDGGLIAEGKPTTLELVLPASVGWDEARAATAHYVGFREHPYPGCFVCGPRRPAGIAPGLGLYPGAVRSPSGQAVVAAPFRPPADLADDQGLLKPEFVWAALDCPSWFGHAAYLEHVPKILLGRLAVHIARRPRAEGASAVGEACVVMGWSLGQEGRRITCASALYDERGDCLAWGKAVWVELKSA